MAGPALYVRHDLLEDFTNAVFNRVGLAESESRIVAASLLKANLRGLDTHGVIRIPAYISRITRGLINTGPHFEEGAKYPWAVAIDGDNAMGAAVASHAMNAALERAATFGIGGATVRHSNHFGAASVYALMAVERGCIGMVLSPASRSLAPYGSMEPLFGTNPIAVALPAGRHAPWVLDMATSVAARGHIRAAALRNEPIPEGWALDHEGRATTDPHAAMKGTMLPFAGPKGSGLSMMIDVFGGVLSGSAFAGDIGDMTRDDRPQDVGHFFLAFKVDAFMAPSEFNARMEKAIERVKGLRPAHGFEEVCYPGELEARREVLRRRTGIPLPPEVAAELERVSAETNIPLPAMRPSARC